MVNLVASNEFNSMFDLVNIALTKFISEYEIEKRNKAIQNIDFCETLHKEHERKIEDISFELIARFGEVE